MVPQNYQIKAEFIQERELFLDDDQLANKDNFPRFLLLRKPYVKENLDEEALHSFVKDIKGAMKLSSATLKNQINNIQQIMSKENAELKKEVQDMINLAN